MSQLVQITLNDGTSDLIFKPAGIDNTGVAALVHGDGIIVANKRLSISSRTTTDRRKGTIKLDLPVVVDETVNGISQPKQVRKAYMRADFDFSVLSTTAERVAARNLLMGALDNALANSVIDNNETIY